MNNYLKPYGICMIYLLVFISLTRELYAQYFQLPQDSAALKPIRVSSDFECGSIDTLIISGNLLQGKTKHWKQADHFGDQYYWFYFRLDHVRNQEVTIQLNDLIGIYRKSIHTVYDNRTQPVFSYDNKHWLRITNTSYNEKDHSFTFIQKFSENHVWIAYAHPYSYSRGCDFISSLLSKPFVEIERIGHSGERRDINLLTITDKSLPNSGKAVVFITALQHSGEYPSGFIVEGLVNFLISEDLAAAEARKNTVFKIIPMLNPDGIIHGITRYNASFQDLNAEWDDIVSDTLNYPVEPEVACVQNWLDAWFKNGNTINLHIDLHSQSQQGTRNVMHMPVKGMLKEYSALLNCYFEIDYLPMMFYGSLTNYMNTIYDMPTTVFEITQSAIGRGTYLTDKDYEYYGEGIVRACRDYFSK